MTTDTIERPAKVIEQETEAYLVDTTAKPDHDLGDGRVLKGSREHAMIVNGATKVFRFEHATPRKMPWSIAAQFLKTDSFMLTNEQGEPVSFKGPPKQPDELQAGERLELAMDETVARLDELQHSALLMRALRLPNGDTMALVRDRQALIDFIVLAKKQMKQVNTVDERKADGFASFIPAADDSEIALFD